MQVKFPTGSKSDLEGAAQERWPCQRGRQSSASLALTMASLAVISTASKHLHNDLAKAIEALEQKKASLALTKA